MTVPNAPWLQRTVVALRESLLPRGWAPLLRACASIAPSLRNYEAKLVDGDAIVVDLRESMCMGYFFYGELNHERATRAILRRALSGGDTFVDVGANIGYYTRMAAHIVGPAGKVFAFEPLPRAYELLQRNAAGLPNVALFPIAVGNHKGGVSFYIHPSGDQSSILAIDCALKQITVEMTDLDTLMPQFERVDLIKIDVEGAELDILNGAKQTIERFEPIVHFEFLQKYAARHGVRLADFEEFFRGFSGADYAIWRVNEKAGGDVLLPPEVDGNDMVAIPRRKRGRLSALISKVEGSR